MSCVRVSDWGSSSRFLQAVAVDVPWEFNGSLGCVIDFKKRMMRCPFDFDVRSRVRIQ